MQPDPSQYEATMRRHREQLRKRKLAGVLVLGRAAQDPSAAAQNVIDNLTPIGEGPRARALFITVYGRPQ